MVALYKIVNILNLRFLVVAEHSVLVYSIEQVREGKTLYKNNNTVKNKPLPIYFPSPNCQKSIMYLKIEVNKYAFFHFGEILSILAILLFMKNFHFRDNHLIFPFLQKTCEDPLLLYVFTTIAMIIHFFVRKTNIFSKICQNLTSSLYFSKTVHLFHKLPTSLAFVCNKLRKKSTVV
jgi:hypothetical protein